MPAIKKRECSTFQASRTDRVYPSRVKQLEALSVPWAKKKKKGSNLPSPRWPEGERKRCLNEGKDKRRSPPRNSRKIKIVETALFGIDIWGKEGKERTSPYSRGKGSRVASSCRPNC